MAKEAGRPLGRVLSMHEVGVSQASPEDEYEDGVRHRFADAKTMFEQAPAPVTRSLPGQRAMMVEVAVSYEI